MRSHLAKRDAVLREFQSKAVVVPDHIVLAASEKNRSAEIACAKGELFRAEGRRNIEFLREGCPHPFKCSYFVRADPAPYIEIPAA